VSGQLRWRLAFSVLGVAVGVLVAYGAVQLDDVRSARALDRARSEALQAADHIVVGVTSMSAATGDRDVKALLTSATGSFREQFSQQATTFEQVLKQSNVTSIGKVVEAGIVTADRHKAAVLTAVTATVKNSAAPTGEQRVYRMLVSLELTRGRWLVSGLEFVA
jgi:Mce-associated membrane protein